MAPLTCTLRPLKPAGLGLNRPAVVVPIDNKGRHQRRHERQDDCDRHSEQRRLCHGASSTSSARSHKVPVQCPQSLNQAHAICTLAASCGDLE